MSQAMQAATSPHTYSYVIQRLVELTCVFSRKYHCQCHIYTSYSMNVASYIPQLPCNPACSQAEMYVY